MQSSLSTRMPVLWPREDRATRSPSGRPISNASSFTRWLAFVQTEPRRKPTFAFAPTGKWLISGADRVERWNLAAGAEWLRLQHGAGVLDVAVSPNARFIATTTIDGFVRVWDTNTSREISRTRSIVRGRQGHLQYCVQRGWPLAGRD